MPGIVLVRQPRSVEDRPDAAGAGQADQSQAVFGPITGVIIVTHARTRGWRIVDHNRVAIRQNTRVVETARRFVSLGWPHMPGCGSGANGQSCGSEYSH